jgi:hypothetical protein
VGNPGCEKPARPVCQPKIKINITATLDRATSLTMDRHFTMPVAQNATIAMRLLCPSDSVSNNAMDMGVVVDRKGFVSGSEEEYAAATTLKRASTAEYLSSFKPG